MRGQPLEFSEFSLGMNSDLPPDKIGIGATEVINFDTRNDKLALLPGTNLHLSDMPSGINFKHAEQFQLSSKYDTTIWLLHGVDQTTSKDKLFVKPYIDPSGSLVDEWQDLTEYEDNLTIDSVTGFSACVISGLASSTDDYYNGFIFVNKTIKKSTLVSDYDGSLTEITFTHSLTGQAASDEVYVMRNPIFMNLGAVEHVYIFQVEGNITFLKNRDDSIQIYTGAGKTYREKTDLKLFAMKDVLQYNDPDYAFNGFFLCSKQIDPTASSGLILASATGATVGIPDPTPSPGYVFGMTVVYDGYQESPIFATYEYEYSYKGLPYIAYPGANYYLDITFYFQTLYGTYGADLYPFTDEALSTDNRFHIFAPRRITSFKLYAAEGKIDGSKAIPSGSFRMVKEIFMDDSGWSGVGSSQKYYTFRLDGAVWGKAPEVDLSNELGHDSILVHGNANMAVASSDRIFVASVSNYFLMNATSNKDETHVDTVYFTPKNASGANTPDVIPYVGASINVADYGMAKIYAMAYTNGAVTILCDRGIVSINSSTLAVSSKVTDDTVFGASAVVGVNGVVYFASDNDMLAYYPSHNVVKSIALGRVREEWRSLTKTNVSVGYDDRLKTVVFAADSTKFLFNVPQAAADPLTVDSQSIGAWTKYSVTKSFIRLWTNFTGQLVGITTDYLLHGLFDASSTESMTAYWKSGTINKKLMLKHIVMKLTGTSDVKVSIYDPQLDDTTSVLDVIMYGDGKEEKDSIGELVESFKLVLAIENASVYDNEVVYFSIDTIPLNKR